MAADLPFQPVELFQNTRPEGHDPLGTGSRRAFWVALRAVAQRDEFYRLPLPVPCCWKYTNALSKLIAFKNNSL